MCVCVCVCVWSAHMATSGRRETKKKAICFSSPPDAQLNAPGPVTSREKRNTHAKKTNKKNHNETNPRQLGKHSLRARSHCRFTEFFFFLPSFCQMIVLYRLTDLERVLFCFLLLVSRKKKSEKKEGTCRRRSREIGMAANPMI